MREPRHEDALVDLLHDIARADERREPPRRLERRVLDAWDQEAARRGTERLASLATHAIEAEQAPVVMTEDGRRHLFARAVRPARSSRWWLVPAVGLLAAAAVVVVRLGPPAVVRVAAPDRVARRGVDSPAPVPSASTARAVVSQPTAETAPAAVGQIEGGDGAVGRNVGARQRASRPPRQTISFVALRPEPLPEVPESFQFARVQLPREVLADLGVMLDGHRGGDPVEADVVFGEDGVARAIRLVSSPGRSQ